jgi:hypothetical protein
MPGLVSVTKNFLATSAGYSKPKNILSESSKTQVNRTTKCLSKRERENFVRPFFLWHFSPGEKTEDRSAQFLSTVSS